MNDVMVNATKNSLTSPDAEVTHGHCLIFRTVANNWGNPPPTIVYPLHSEIHFKMSAGLGIKERFVLAFRGLGA